MEDLVAGLAAQLTAAGRRYGAYPQASLVVGGAAVAPAAILAGAGLPADLAPLEPRELDALANELWQTLAGGIVTEVGAIDSMDAAWAWVQQLVLHLADDGDIRGSRTHVRGSRFENRVFALVTPRRTVVIVVFGDD